MAHPLNPYRPKSRRFLVAEHFLAGHSDTWTFRQLKRLVWTGALVFSRNVNGRRVPAPVDEQIQMLRRTIRTTFADMRKVEALRDARNRGYEDRLLNGAESSTAQVLEQSIAEFIAQNPAESAVEPVESAVEPVEPVEQDYSYSSPAPDVGGADVESVEPVDPETDEPVEPVEPEPEPAAPATSVQSEAEHFYAEVQRLREFVRSRDNFDSLDSMRVVIDGAKAIKAGLPVEGLLSAIGASWQSETRVQARIPDFDYAAWRKPDDPKAHGASEYVFTLIKAGVNVWLYGPAGTGKSSLARYSAEKLGLPYYEVNLAGAMPSAIKGKDRLKEFVESEFTRAYRDGGVMCLEEFDSAHPTVATAVNNAIANGHFHNDADGRVYEKHPDFRIVVTANTLGTGATKEFNGRMKLDGATIDRFRVGRVYVGLDTNLERSIFDSLLNDA